MRLNIALALLAFTTHAFVLPHSSSHHSNLRSLLKSDNTDLLVEVDGQEELKNTVNSLTSDQRKRLNDQIERLNEGYPGGIEKYVLKARKLLRVSTVCGEAKGGWGGCS